MILKSKHLLTSSSYYLFTKQLLGSETMTKYMNIKPIRQLNCQTLKNCADDK